MNAVSRSQLWKKRLGDWVINPYVGCTHGCVFCYCPAMPGVKFFNEGRTQAEWGSYVIPKEGIVEALRNQLRNFTPDKAKVTNWGDGWVLMSFLTDCYQPKEAGLKLTRQCLQLLLEAGHKVRIQTRSALVKRDFDILKAHPGQVLLGTSIPSFDEGLTRILEPRAASLPKRWQMLFEAKNAEIPVYLAIAPWMPWVPPFEVMSITERASALNPREIFCEVLNPKGGNVEMVRSALLASGRKDEAEQISNYGAVAWSLKTADLRSLWHRTLKFTPWPDTGRAWAKHLNPEMVAWLDQFLPPKEVAAA